MSAADAIRQKISIQYAKEGLARFFSHHDMIRFFERAVRRAELPVRLTSGFNPRPRITFTTQVAVGIGSQSESLEIEFADDVVPDTVAQQLAGLMLPGMRVLSVETLPPKRRGRHVERYEYLLRGFPDSGPQAGALAEATRELSELDSLPVERFGRKGRRCVDIAPSIESVVLQPEGVRLTVRMVEDGTARADEVGAWLGKRCGVEAKDVRIERTRADLSW